MIGRLVNVKQSHFFCVLPSTDSFWTAPDVISYGKSESFLVTVYSWFIELRDINRSSIFSTSFRHLQLMATRNPGSTHQFSVKVAEIPSKFYTSQRGFRAAGFLKVLA